MWFVWCAEGDQVWVEARFGDAYDAEDYAEYLRRSVPGRDVWVDDERGLSHP